MHEWMMQRPDRPQFDMQGMRDARGSAGGIPDFLAQWRSQLGDWRGQMRDWRQDRPQMGHGPQMQGQPIPGGPNTQFPLNPGAGGPIQGQQIPGSSYGFNLGDVFSRFPNGMGNGQPGPNPGY